MKKSREITKPQSSQPDRIASTVYLMSCRTFAFKSDRDPSILLSFLEKKDEAIKGQAYFITSLLCSNQIIINSLMKQQMFQVFISPIQLENTSEIIKTSIFRILTQILSIQRYKNTCFDLMIQSQCDGDYLVRQLTQTKSQVVRLALVELLICISSDSGLIKFVQRYIDQVHMFLVNILLSKMTTNDEELQIFSILVNIIQFHEFNTRNAASLIKFIIDYISQASKKDDLSKNKSILLCLKMIANGVSQNNFAEQFTEQKGFDMLSDCMNFKDIEIRHAVLVVYARFSLEENQRVLIILERQIIEELLLIEPLNKSNLTAIKTLLIILIQMLRSSSDHATRQLDQIEIVSILQRFVLEQPILAPFALIISSYLLNINQFSECVFQEGQFIHILRQVVQTIQAEDAILALEAILVFLLSIKSIVEQFKIQDVLSFVQDLYKTWLRMHDVEIRKLIAQILKRLSCMQSQQVSGRILELEKVQEQVFASSFLTKTHGEQIVQGILKSTIKGLHFFQRPQKSIFFSDELLFTIDEIFSEQQNLKDKKLPVIKSNSVNRKNTTQLSFASQDSQLQLRNSSINKKDAETITEDPINTLIIPDQVNIQRLKENKQFDDAENIVKSVTEIGNEMYTHFYKNIRDLTQEVAELKNELNHSKVHIHKLKLELDEKLTEIQTLKTHQNLHEASVEDYTNQIRVLKWTITDQNQKILSNNSSNASTSNHEYNFGQAIIEQLRIELADMKLKMMVLQEEFSSYRLSFNFSEAREQNLMLVEQNLETFNQNQKIQYEKLLEEVKIKLDEPQNLLDLCQRINRALEWMSSVQKRSNYQDQLITILGQKNQDLVDQYESLLLQHAYLQNQVHDFSIEQFTEDLFSLTKRQRIKIQELEDQISNYRSVIILEKTVQSTIVANQEIISENEKSLIDQILKLNERDCVKKLENILSLVLKYTTHLEFEVTKNYQERLKNEHHLNMWQREVEIIKNIHVHQYHAANKTSKGDQNYVISQLESHISETQHSIKTANSKKKLDAFQVPQADLQQCVQEQVGKIREILLEVREIKQQRVKPQTTSENVPKKAQGVVKLTQGENKKPRFVNDYEIPQRDKSKLFVYMDQIEDYLDKMMKIITSEPRQQLPQNFDQPDQLLVTLINQVDVLQQVLQNRHQESKKFSNMLQQICLANAQIKHTKNFSASKIQNKQSSDQYLEIGEIQQAILQRHGEQKQYISELEQKLMDAEQRLNLKSKQLKEFVANSKIQELKAGLKVDQNDQTQNEGSTNIQKQEPLLKQLDLVMTENQELKKLLDGNEIQIKIVQICALLNVHLPQDSEEMTCGSQFILKRLSQLEKVLSTNQKQKITQVTQIDQSQILQLYKLRFLRILKFATSLVKYNTQDTRFQSLQSIFTEKLHNFPTELDEEIKLVQSLRLITEIVNLNKKLGKISKEGVAQVPEIKDLIKVMVVQGMDTAGQNFLNPKPDGDEGFKNFQLINNSKGNFLESWLRRVESLFEKDQSKMSSQQQMCLELFQQEIPLILSLSAPDLANDGEVSFDNFYLIQNLKLQEQIKKLESESVHTRDLQVQISYLISQNTQLRHERPVVKKDIHGELVAKYERLLPRNNELTLELAQLRIKSREQSQKIQQLQAELELERNCYSQLEEFALQHQKANIEKIESVKADPQNKLHEYLLLANEMLTKEINHLRQQLFEYRIQQDKQSSEIQTLQEQLRLQNQQLSDTKFLLKEQILKNELSLIRDNSQTLNNLELDQIGKDVNNFHRYLVNEFGEAGKVQLLMLLEKIKSLAIQMKEQAQVIASLKYEIQVQKSTSDLVNSILAEKQSENRQLLETKQDQDEKIQNYEAELHRMNEQCGILMSSQQIYQSYVVALDKNYEYHAIINSVISTTGALTALCHDTCKQRDMFKGQLEQSQQLTSQFRNEIRMHKDIQHELVEQLYDWDRQKQFYESEVACLKRSLARVQGNIYSEESTIVQEQRMEMSKVSSLLNCERTKSKANEILLKTLENQNKKVWSQALKDKIHAGQLLSDINALRTQNIYLSRICLCLIPQKQGDDIQLIKQKLQENQVDHLRAENSQLQDQNLQLEQQNSRLQSEQDIFRNNIHLTHIKILQDQVASLTEQIQTLSQVSNPPTAELT